MAESNEINNTIYDAVSNALENKNNQCITLLPSSTGKSAYDLAVDYGYIGTESMWLDTLQGKTTYDLAVEYGYKGSERDWLSSIANDTTVVSNLFADAQSFSDFMSKASTVSVPRRLAPPINTLNYYLDYLRALELVYSQQTGVVNVNGVQVKAITQAVKDALNSAAIDNNTQVDTLITATSAGVGMIARTQNDVNNYNVHIKRFVDDTTGLTDVTSQFNKALAYCQANDIALNLGSSTLLTQGDHTYSGTILSQNATIKRTANYTGISPLLILEDNAEVQGSITFDGNNPSEAGTFYDSFPSLRVDGDGVTIYGRLTLLNTPMYTQGAKQLSGCHVYGDNFKCGDVYGNFCGYRTIGLRILGQMKSFIVGNVESYNHHYKGIGIGADSGAYIKNIIIGNIVAETADDFAHNASDGLLVDCDNDNRILQIENMKVGYINIVGSRANCIKVENVKNFYCSDINLDVTTTLSVGNAMRMEAEYFSCGSITFNKNRIRLRSLHVDIKNIFCNHPETATIVNYVYFEGLTHVEGTPDYSIFGNRSCNIGSIIALNSSSTLYLIGINIEQDVSYRIHIGHINAPNMPFYFANYDLNSGGRERFIAGDVSVGKCNDRYKLHAESNLQKQIGDGNRVFYSRAGAPTVGSYKITDYVYNAQSTILGTTPNQYIVRGWICTTAGDSGSFVFTTDRVIVY